MKEKTAVQWIVDELFKQKYFNSSSMMHKNLEHLQKKALELERLQHGQTWNTALDKYEVRAGNYMRAYEDFDDYYEQFKQD
jgi:hypothetical protein